MLGSILVRMLVMNSIAIYMIIGAKSIPPNEDGIYRLTV